MTAGAPGTLTTATVLFTDVVGSTSTRTSLGEELADDHFRRHEQLLRAVVAAHGAIFVKGLGDGLMALFSSATVALEASAAIEQAVEGENEYAVAPVAVRAALSAGDVCWTDDDVSGLPVIEAARLVDVAHGGQVLCTDLVAARAGAGSARVQGPRAGARQRTRRAAAGLRAALAERRPGPGRPGAAVAEEQVPAAVRRSQP